MGFVVRRSPSLSDTQALADISEISSLRLGVELSTGHPQVINQDSDRISTHLAPDN